ncbi:hypothetical protein [Bizionia myxarmorum]|uniref:DUF4919 domain-containing protein n=1 Tax=Bizionia myxarmorum TaxID=291186 RepID=A0A5D0QVF6_9FLAO|nr:hypothetical protein [Bizionia myxarmorum]TYB73177.1 hypothetical protein ES674_15130 [Bizionia myxarmorum]
MKRSYLLLIFTLIFCFPTTDCLAQNADKKIIYKNLDGKKICKRKFRNKIKPAVFVKTTETDTYIIKRLSNRIVDGQFSSINQESFYREIENIVQQKVDPSKKLVLHYYKKQNEAFEKDVADDLYWDFIKRNSSEFASYLIVSKDSNIPADADKNVFVDGNNYLESEFFTESDSELYHMLLRPDGSYKLFYGSFDIVYILDGVL